MDINEALKWCYDNEAVLKFNNERVLIECHGTWATGHLLVDAVERMIKTLKGN